MQLLIIKKECGLTVASFLLFFLGFSLKAAAGNKFALYLKNGTIVRCERYRHLPGSPYEVQINKYTHLTIPEEKIFAEGPIYRHALEDYQLDYKYDSLTGTYIKLPNHFVRVRGFFFQCQVSVIMIDGIRVAMGYRFCTGAALGLGIGAEYSATIFSQYNQCDPTKAPSYVNNSGYSPFYLFLIGDFNDAKITPFYSVELGYNLPWYPHLQTDEDDGSIPPPYSYYTNYGGLMGGLGIGCRFYSRKLTNVSISANMNAAYLSIKTDFPNRYVNYQNPVYKASTSWYTMLQPSLRFSFGF